MQTVNAPGLLSTTGLIVSSLLDAVNVPSEAELASMVQLDVAGMNATESLASNPTPVICGIIIIERVVR